MKRRDWRDGSAVEGTSRGLGFNAQLPHGNSELPVTGVPEDLVPSCGL